MDRKARFEKYIAKLVAELIIKKGSGPGVKALLLLEAEESASDDASSVVSTLRQNTVITLSA
jgi:hypothetical protein